MPGRCLLVPDLAQSYAEDLAEIATLRGLPSDTRRRIMLAHNEIVLLRQRLEDACERYAVASRHIEELESRNAV